MTDLDLLIELTERDIASAGKRLSILRHWKSLQDVKTATVTTDEAAEMLGISRQSVQKWIKAGKLKATRPGNAYRVLLSSIHNANLGIREEGQIGLDK